MNAIPSSYIERNTFVRVLLVLLGILLSPYPSHAQLKPAPDLIAWDTTSSWAPLHFLDAGAENYVVGFDSLAAVYFWAPIDDSLNIDGQFFLDSGFVFSDVLSNGEQFLFSGIAQIDSAVYANTSMVWDVNIATMMVDTGSVRYSFLIQNGLYLTKDGGGFISSIGRRVNSPFLNTMVAKFDQQGAFEWESSNHIPPFGAPRKIVQLDNGLIFLLPFTYNGISTFNFLTIFNEEGDSINTKTNLRGSSELIPSYDKGLFLIGSSIDSLNRAQVYVSKIDSSCDLIWEKSHIILKDDSLTKGAQFERCISTRDGGLLVLVTLAYDTGPVQARVLYFLKMDKFGTPQWEKTIPQVGTEFIKIVDMHERGDGSVLLGGYLEELFGPRGANYLGLLAADGSFPLSIENHFPVSFNIHPNPVTESFQVFWDQLFPGIVEVRVVDLHGREWFSEEIVKTKGQHSVLVPFSDATAGIYLIQISISQGTISRTFIKH